MLRTCDNDRFVRRPFHIQKPMNEIWRNLEASTVPSLWVFSSRFVNKDDHLAYD